MICRDVVPSPALREYVKYYAVIHFEFDQHAILPFKPYGAKPEHCLTFLPRGGERVEYLHSGTIEKRPRSILLGQHTVRTNRYAEKDFMLIQVHFHLGMLYRLTGIPFQQLTNTAIDAEAVFGQRIRELNDRLNSTEDYWLMIRMVETFLLECVGKPKQDLHPVDTIGKLLLEQPTGYSLDYLCDQACLCPSQFERKFIQRMGIPPKLLARIARFDQSFRLKESRPQLDWLSIALACGYHDYQHLVRDYKDFAGIKPTLYWAQETNAPEHYFAHLDRSTVQLD